MPKVFYTSGEPHRQPSPNLNRSAGASDSEADTDVEPSNAPPRRKLVHRRSDSMELETLAPQVAEVATHGNETDISYLCTAKRPRRPGNSVVKPGNAVVRQRQTSREVRDATGQRPLQKASARGDLDRVMQLLADQPDLEDRDYAGTTALHSAALNGHALIVDALLNAGAVVDVRSGADELDTPLMDAAANGSRETVKRLLEAGADPRVINARGRMAIDFIDEDDDSSDVSDMAGIIHDLQKRTRQLRRAGKPVINSPQHSRAPASLFPPNFQGVKRPPPPGFLDVSKRNVRHDIEEHAATGDLPYVGLALERGWRPTARALVLSAKYGHSEVVGLMLAFGMDANAEYERVTALERAIERDNMACAKLLVDSGAVVRRGYARLVADMPVGSPVRVLVLGEEDSESGPERDRVRSVDDDDDKDEELQLKVEPKDPKDPKERRESLKETEKLVKAYVKDTSKEPTRDRDPMEPTRNHSRDSSRDLSRDLIRESTTREPVKIDAVNPKPKPEFKLTESKIGLRSMKPKKRTNSEFKPEPSPGEWAERSQELSQLAERKEKERRSRELQMLESLRLQESSLKPNTPDSEPAMPGTPVGDSPSRSPVEQSPMPSASYSVANSPAASPAVHSPAIESVRSPGDSSHPHSRPQSRSASRAQTPDVSIELTSMPDSAELPDSTTKVLVTNLPYAVRQLAYTGAPQPAVAPLYTHTIDGVPHFLDLQLALALGEPRLHLKYRDLVKCPIYPQNKELIWSFCQPWICRPGASPKELIEEKQNFLSLGLCWVSVPSIEEIFSMLPPQIALRRLTETVTETSTETEHSRLPIAWQLQRT